MAITNASEVVPFDAGEVTRAVQDATTGTGRSIVEYDREEFNPLYVDDVTMAFYADEAEMLDHFAEIHSYVHVAFTEMSLFTDELFPVANEVRYLTASFDTMTLLRIYFDDEGVFVSLDPEVSVEPIVDAVEAVYSAS